MKNKFYRALAVLSASALLAGQTGYMNVYAEGETQVASEEAPAAPETEAPAPQTEAPTPETEAPAPQTEAPTPETEAPAPQTEAPAPQTEAPAPQTEAPAPQTETPETQAPETELPLPVVEPTTELQTETDAKVGKFTATFDGGTVDVVLSPGVTLPASTVLTVTELTGDQKSAAVGQIRTVTDEGHRELAGSRVFALVLTDKSGQQVLPDGGMTASFTFSTAADLNLQKYQQPEAKVYTLGAVVGNAGSAELSADRTVASFRVSLGNETTVALAGIQNHINDGDPVTQKDLKDDLGDALDYAVVTNDYTGADAVEDEIAAASDENSELGASEISTMLTDLSDVSLDLANAQSSDDVTVVNIYADEDGKIDTEPMKAVLADNQLDVDVTDTAVVVNVVADYADQKLEIPVYSVANDNTEEGQEVAETAGKVLYNVVAMDGTDFADYTGTATLKDPTQGTLLASKATLNVEKALVGAAYTDAVDASDAMIVKAALLQKAEIAGAPEGEKDTEETTEEPDTEEPTTEGERIDQEIDLTFRVVDDDGADLPDAKIAVLDKDGNVLVDDNKHEVAFTTTDQPTTYNLDLKHYRLFDGMKIGDTITLTVTEVDVPEGYNYAGDIKQTVTFTRQEDGKVVAEPTEIVFKNTQNESEGNGTIEVTKTLFWNDTAAKGSENQIDRTYYLALFKDAKHTERVSEVKEAVVEKEKVNGTATFEKLAEGTYYLAETDEFGVAVENADADQTFYVKYEFAKEDTEGIQITAEEKQDPHKVTVENHEYAVKVKKSVKLKNGSSIYANGKMYYVALFAKDKDQKPVSNIASMKMPSNGKDAVVWLTGVTPGKYILKETSKNGKPYSESGLTITYDKDQKITVEKGKPVSEEENVSIINTYSEIPDGAYVTRQFKLRVVMLDEKGEEVNTGKEIDVKINQTQSSKKAATIPVKANTGFNTYRVIVKESAVKVAVSGTAQDGFTVTNPDAITLSADKTDKPEMTITYKKESQKPTEETKEPETKGPESETTDPELLKNAKITFTKSVTYKGEAVRVNKIYYIGMWKDDPTMSGEPFHVKKIKLSNASSASASVTIDLTRASKNSVTFYIAEVDKNGKRMGSDEYTITQDVTSVTLDSKHLTASASFTNDVKAGGSAEEELLDPSSGFAGDNSALAEAQELKANGNSGVNTKTGDNNPIGILIGVAAVSLLLIAAIVVILIRRSKR